MFVVEEYSARYGVRDSFRHLSFVDLLLRKADEGYFIDPMLIHCSYSFASSHVHGIRNDGVAVVLMEEKEQFAEIKQRLLQMIEKELSNFRMSFPFGRPDGALKSLLTLLETVLYRDAVTPPTTEEVREVVGRCLENAACNSYTKLTTDNLDDGAALEEDEVTGEMYMPIGRKLEQITRLAEMCVELMQQNSTNYTEAFAWFSDLFVDHAEIFWSLFAADMDSILMELSPNSWDAFPLFQTLNEFLLSDENFKNGRFHQHLQEVFAPMIIRYVDLMESSIAQSLHKGFEKERWEIKGNGCSTSEELFWRLAALQGFIDDLNWPDLEFSSHLDHRIKRIASDMIESLVQRIDQAFTLFLRRTFVLSSTVFMIPTEICAMVNVVFDSRSHCLQLCSSHGGDVQQFHGRLDALMEQILSSMLARLVERLVMVLDNLLTKLSRYDKGSLMGSILGFTYKQNISGTGKDLAQTYVDFTRKSMEQLRQKIIDEIWILYLLETWYSKQMEHLCSWLSDRSENDLHPYQVMILSQITKKLHSDFELQGVSHEKLSIKLYETVRHRIQSEETTCSSFESTCPEKDTTNQSESCRSSRKSFHGDQPTVASRTPSIKPNNSSASDQTVATKVASATTSAVGKVGEKVGGVFGDVSKGLTGLKSKMVRPSFINF